MSIDVYRDTTTYDKLIFPSAITRIIRQFSVPFPAFDHFSFMCVIDAATVKRYEAQFRSRQSGSATPSSRSAPSRSAPSTFAPTSSTSDMSLGDIMVQLQYQVNIHVGRIARQQTIMDGFVL